MSFIYKVDSVSIFYSKSGDVSAEPETSVAEKSLESLINRHAKEGWRLISTVPVLGGTWGYGGHPAFSITSSIVVTFEKEVN